MRNRGNAVEDTQEPGSLYIVSTPIGNLEDITYRAVRILKEVDLIAAEDTRRTRKLLVHYHIFTPMTSYHDHNERGKYKELLKKLLDGRDIALVSDAGTPGVSDPGYRLVKAAIEEGLEVVPIPGASAVLAALSVCGLPIDRFFFQGFLPPKKQKRIDTVVKLSQEPTTSVLFVSPHKLKNSLEEIKIHAGSAQLVLIREITKVYEEIFRGTASEIIKEISGRTIKGEITLVMRGSKIKTVGPRKV